MELRPQPLVHGLFAAQVLYVYVERAATQMAQTTREGERAVFRIFFQALKQFADPLYSGMPVEPRPFAFEVHRALHSALYRFDMF
jgi:hypothetical protein